MGIMSLQEKIVACREILRELDSVVVAFSGGVDSAYLLALSVETIGAGRVLAAMGISPSIAKREQEQGRSLARSLGVELVEVQTNELDEDDYSANPPDRCFFCKTELFHRLQSVADDHDMAHVVCGTNADDAEDYRPGILAAEKLGVRSPLLEARMTKEDIRMASKAMDLPTWNKPASPCLASRVAYRERITEEKLSRIEQAEILLKDLDFEMCRVRDHGTLARIELIPDLLGRALALREVLTRELKSLGYTYVTLDLQGFRSGSMNETLPH